MPSPFPGMNPYLEQADHWQDFHTEFLIVVRRLLNAQIGPGYAILLDKHVYIHDIPPEPRRSLGRPDLSLVLTGHATGNQPGLGILEAPTEIDLPTQDVERSVFLEIRDRSRRELITVIELLSPSNKRPGEDRQQYLTKRRVILRGEAHLVEIDLLRGWAPMPAARGPERDYSILVSRAGRRPKAEFWPIRLRDRLPVVPIPIRPTDADLRIDLQEALHIAYDGACYEKIIYEGSPEPPLSAADADWAAQFVPGTA